MRRFLRALVSFTGIVTGFAAVAEYNAEVMPVAIGLGVVTLFLLYVAAWELRERK